MTPISEAAAFLQELNAACALVFQHAPVKFSTARSGTSSLDSVRNPFKVAWNRSGRVDRETLAKIVSGWHEEVASRFQNSLREGKEIDKNLAAGLVLAEVADGSAAKRRCAAEDVQPDASRAAGARRAG